MVKTLLDLIMTESSPYIDISSQSSLFETEIKKETESLDVGMLIKVSDFETGKDDGVYLSKKEKLIIHIVKKSFKSDKEIDKEDFERLLAYSYIVRALAYMQNSPFDIIRTFTQKSNEIISRYM